MGTDFLVAQRCPQRSAQRPALGRQPAIWSPCGVAMHPLPSATNTDPQVVLAGFSDLPPKPPRSKLEPHRDLIRELRRKEQTYRDVARLFQERLGLYVAPSTLHSFVKVRAKHRKRSQFELPPIELAATEVSPVLDRVAALKARPTASNAKPARFVFRESEPLTLTSDGGEQ
jgi:hypothetical protein